MIDIGLIDFDKMSGLVPAIIIDHSNDKVLMLGYMNKEAVEKTIATKLVTFFSRSKNRLWTKGETSKNYLKLVNIKLDCDRDTLLISAIPNGPVCHTGSYSCFGIANDDQKDFLAELFELIEDRKKKMPENSYTTKLFKSGSDRIIQKVGEESIETIIAAKNRKSETVYEVSDLLYHLLVMLSSLEIDFKDVIEELRKRHSEK